MAVTTTTVTEKASPRPSREGARQQRQGNSDGVDSASPDPQQAHRGQASRLWQPTVDGRGPSVPVRRTLEDPEAHERLVSELQIGTSDDEESDGEGRGAWDAGGEKEDVVGLSDGWQGSLAEEMGLEEDNDEEETMTDGNERRTSPSGGRTQARARHSPAPDRSARRVTPDAARGDRGITRSAGELATAADAEADVDADGDIDVGIDVDFEVQHGADVRREREAEDDADLDNDGDGEDEDAGMALGPGVSYVVRLNAPEIFLHLLKVIGDTLEKIPLRVQMTPKFKGISIEGVDDDNICAVRGSPVRHAHILRLQAHRTENFIASRCSSRRSTGSPRPRGSR